MQLPVCFSVMRTAKFHMLFKLIYWMRPGDVAESAYAYGLGPYA